MADATDVHFDVEDTITAGDRVDGLWRYSWADGHVRGADVMRVRDSRVANLRQGLSRVPSSVLQGRASGGVLDQLRVPVVI
jgi:hypothetical protein